MHREPCLHSKLQIFLQARSKIGKPKLQTICSLSEHVLHVLCAAAGKWNNFLWYHNSVVQDRASVDRYTGPELVDHSQSGIGHHLAERTGSSVAVEACTVVGDLPFLLFQS